MFYSVPRELHRAAARKPQDAEFSYRPARPQRRCWNRLGSPCVDGAAKADIAKGGRLQTMASKWVPLAGRLILGSRFGVNLNDEALSPIWETPPLLLGVSGSLSALVRFGYLGRRLQSKLLLLRLYQQYRGNKLCLYSNLHQ
jgi:hypothetical protein